MASSGVSFPYKSEGDAIRSLVSHLRNYGTHAVELYGNVYNVDDALRIIGQQPPIEVVTVI